MLLAESQLATISQNIRYLKSIDPLNAEIIRECSRLGPTNLSSVARSLKIPVETVRYRFLKLRRIGVFTFNVFERYSKLGLIRCSVFTSASPQEEKQQLRDSLAAVEYWTYLARSFGYCEGCYAVYALPYANRSEFEYYLQEAEKQGIIKDYQAILTGDSYTTTPNFQWFNFKKHYWVFPWEDWIEDAESASAAPSHQVLEDPKDYSSRLDNPDLQILSLLEEDAGRGLREIGRHLGFTASGVKYHWDHHIVEQGVVQGFRTKTTGYPVGLSDIFAFHFRCKNLGKLARLVNFFADKVFVVSFAKVLRQNNLIVHIRIPKTEFERMITFMSAIRRSLLVEDFTYVKLDLSGYSACTIRPHNFKNGSWSYELDLQLETLRSIVKGEVKRPLARVLSSKQQSSAAF